MSAISTILTRLRAAIWAIDVRDDIANAIEQCYSDVSNPTLKTEALEAALQEKIDQGEMAALTIGDHTITAAKLANGVIPAADATLTETGKPADAAETGRQIGLIKADLGDLNSGKEALLGVIRDMVRDPGTNGVSYEKLCNVFFPNEVPDSITATYTQGVVTTDNDLDDLRNSLVVKAISGNTNKTVTDYMLIGELVEGTCTVVVAYHGKTTSFDVVVSAAGERLWINGYTAQNIGTTNVAAHPFYFPTADYSYSYPVKIKSVRLNIKTVGTLTFGHATESNVTKYIDKEVAQSTLNSGVIADEVATFANTGVQKYTFQNPITLTSGQCFAFCKTGDTAAVAYGPNSNDLGFYYFRTSDGKLKHQTTYGLGIDVFIE